VAREILKGLEAKVHPSKAAVIVIDMQNAFCAQDGSVGRTGRDTSMCREMAPNLLSFIDSARNTGVPVIWVRLSLDPDTETPPNYVEQRARRGSPIVCNPGSYDEAFIEGFGPGPGEHLITKCRYDAFFGTNLESVLRALDRETIIVTGVGTNVCVESTVRDGFFRGYYIVIPADCVATANRDHHRASLESMDRYFGEVTDASAIVGCWQTVSQPASAAVAV
jgi:ureidoacrylate peracid hydrolase